MNVVTGRWPNGKEFIVFDYIEHMGDLSRTVRICWTPKPIEVAIHQPNARSNQQLAGKD